MKKLQIGISRCLLGERVRYDGGHQRDPYITDTLGRYFDYVPVCPEVEYGLPIPRDVMRLVGSPTAPRLVTLKTGLDHTEGMLRWASSKLEELEKNELCGFIFKSKSPSSGMQAVKVYGPSGMPVHKGVGIFAGAFMKRFPFLPVEDEERLHNPLLRENFIERVFVYKRWREFMKEGRSVGKLIDFHSDHKLLLLSHSPKHCSILGRLVAAAKDHKDDLYGGYIQIMTEGLRLMATTKKQTNVLTHIVGYFKKELTTHEKQELLETIGHFHAQLVPFVVPMTLIDHYVRRFDQPYLRRQHYINPDPVELMLRNHA
jgi:uncharacterized protein YbgA (DUF1722 family)/uncharacterized protein YbbK (DUF523 family)